MSRTFSQGEIEAALGGEAVETLIKRRAEIDKGLTAMPGALREKEDGIGWPFAVMEIGFFFAMAYIITHVR